MPPKIRDRGRLYAQADQFKAALAASETAAADQMLAAWTDSYWGVRRELDGFLAKVAKARAEGVAPGVSWAYQERRLRNVLDETKVQINRYAADASQVTSRQQRSAINAAAAHADRLTRTAVEVSLPGLEATFGRINPADLESMVGFLANGSVLRNHLAATLPAETADAVKAALIHGLATGKSQDWMTRQATRALGISHGRAITIMRTESLRAYRATSKAVYQANRDIVGEWTWHAALDRRCCMACVAMHGTHHPVDADLDGHPRCRCAMVPRTRSWSDILGPDGDDIPDSRPAIETGEDWFTRQTPSVQRGLMGGQKFDAWQKGEFTLPEVVARTSDPDWGTMRTERSLKAIREGRNANWMDAPVPGPSAPAPAPVAPPATPPKPAPKPDPVNPLADVSEADLKDALSGPVEGRAAAQDELIRRLDEKGKAAQAARREKLARYAGDGKTWTEVPDMPMRTFQRGRHTAEVPVDLGDELPKFLADVAHVTDALPLEGIRPVTFRVPAGDPTFRERIDGFVGAYVYKGIDVVFVNPKVARGWDGTEAGKRAQNMPASTTTTSRRWTLAHELGHIFDHQHDHTEDARKAGGLWRKHKTGMGSYGRTKRGEGYAEAWAQWLVGGPGSSPVSDAYAKEYGWPRPRS